VTIKLPDSRISMENFQFFQNAIADDSDKHVMFSRLCRRHFNLNVYEIYSLDLFCKLDHLGIL
jgi:hypothetical protein